MNRSLVDTVSTSSSFGARYPRHINLNLPTFSTRSYANNSVRSPTRGGASSTQQKKPRSPRSSPSCQQEQKLAKRSARRIVSRETQLVILSRKNEWEAVLERLKQYPEEAEPQRLEQDEAGIANSGNQIRAATSLSESAQTDVCLYQETALSYVCSQADLDANDGGGLEQRLLYDLIKAIPKQAIVSQLHKGHTALRSLVRNITCTTESLKILLDGMQKALNGDRNELCKVCYETDRDGLNPLDHIIQRFHFNEVPCTGAKKPINLLKIFMDVVGLKEYHSASQSSSPLIRLLSLGNLASARGQNIATNPSDAIAEATGYFIQNFPDLLHQCSMATRCTPLHMALRNYGNQMHLMEWFLLGLNQMTNGGESRHAGKEREPRRTKHFPAIFHLLHQSNQFGDLPLHVACSVGAPVPVLRLVLDGTLQAKPHGKNSCWRVNRAGYTPIDLEWIRHMEDGKGLLMARTFYPLEAGGIRKTWWKQDEFYQLLLQQAVQQAMKSKIAGHSFSTADCARAVDVNYRPMDVVQDLNPSNHSTTSLPRPAQAQAQAQAAPPNHKSSRAYPSTPMSEQPTWELLLHRIFLILQSAATGRVPKSQQDLAHCLLHAACQLLSPLPPSIPQPLLKLILWMYPSQLLQRYSSIEGENVNKEEQKSGNLPLHFALLPHFHDGGFLVNDADENNEQLFSTVRHVSDEWEMCIKMLLLRAPGSARRRNLRGRIPLHMALEYCDELDTIAHDRIKPQGLSPLPCMTTSPQRARLSVVHALLEAFPDSVDIRDPITGLLPFQMAALSPHLPLEAVFHLLKRSPDAISV